MTAPPKTPQAPKPRKDEKSQRERFIEFAEKHGADDPEALDKALGDLSAAPAAKPKKPEN